MRTNLAAGLAMTMLLLVGAAAAQAPTATLVGRIVDPSRAGIPGAAIKVRSVDTNQIRTALSQDSGEFTVSSLPPGVYEVTIDGAGFKSLHQKNLELQADQTARLDVQLEIGTLSESVEVTAALPVVNTEISSRGDVIAPTEIAEMPLNGRDFNDLVFNVAGVQPAEENAKGSPYVVNGARADSSNVMIDGINDQNPRDAGAQARPPLDSLQEFKLETSGYSAEYGRLAGGLVNMVLKSGANRFHGGLFEFIRNDAFDARNFFDQGKSKLRRNQFGADLSGPVVIPRLYDGHDKTFFLFNWESQRQVEGTNQIGIVPSALERQGDFSQSFDASGKLILIKDPLLSGSCSASKTTACFKGNLIPTTRFDPISQKLMAYYPAPNLQGVNNFIVNAVNDDDWDSFVLKLDQKLSSKDNLSVRALLRWQTSTDPFSGTDLGTFGSVTDRTQELFGISETRVFTPTLINEFRMGVARTVNEELSTHAGTNYAAQLGILGTTTDPRLAAFPKFSITGLEVIGDSTQNPIRYAVTNYDYNDVMTWNKGRHTLKFGGSFLRVQYYQPTNSNFNGTFTFNGKISNYGLSDFLLGYPSSTSRKIGTVTNHLYITAIGAFIQDDFKLSPSLTLNLGLRYEIPGTLSEKDGQMTNYVPSIGKTIVASAAMVPNLDAIVASAGVTGLIGVAKDYGLPGALVYANHDNFAPRAGFAWRPFGNSRTVIRGGYGIFYTGSRLSAMRTDLTGGFPFSISQSFTGSANNPSQLTISNPFPASIAKFSGVTSTSGYELHPPSSYLQSWNMTFERELLQGVAVELSYTGSKGTHLGRKYDINQQLRLPNNALPNGSYPRPYAGYGDIQYYSFGFNSNYQAGTLTIRKRFQKGLFFRANYTYGKSIDENSGLNYAGAGGFQGAQNSLNPFGERGRSDFDVRHVFSMNFAYRLPFTRTILVRDWQFAGTGGIYSGQPFTPKLSGPSIDQGQATRPDRIAGGALANPSQDKWFDVSAFAIVPDSAFRYGNSGRNILDGPGSVAFNLSLSRYFRIGEHHRLQFRWEAFNVTNHTNFRLPNVTLDKASAGTITESKPARVMQLGVKYQF